MKKFKLNSLELKKTKIARLLDLDLSKVKGGNTTDDTISYPYLGDKCNDYDYSTNGCYTTWTT